MPNRLKDWHGAVVIDERTKARVEYDSLTEAVADLKQRAEADHAVEFRKSFSVSGPLISVEWTTDGVAWSVFTLYPLGVASA